MASASSPTAAYNAQNGVTAAGSYDPLVVDWVRQAAAATGADPVALLATSLQESGAQRGRVGDAGTSYGPFQFHRGGALGSHTPAWANTYAAVLNRAQEFKRGQVHHGKGAAAVQRPRDQGLYTKGVDSLMERARAILDEHGATTRPAATSPSREGVQATGPAAATPSVGDKADVGDLILQSFIDANAHLAKLPGSAALENMPAGASPIQRALNTNAGLAGIGAPTLPTGGVKTGAGTPTPSKTLPTLKVGGKGVGTPAGVAAVNLAKQYLGTPYVWGGESPKGFDCSGLLQFVWAKRGVKIPRVTYAQINAGKAVNPAQIQPGDAVFFNHGKHVGMAIGNGQFIESPHTGASVRISSLATRKDIAAVRRYA